MRLNIPHGQAPLTALLEEIRPKPPDARHEVGEVRLALLLDPLLQVRRRYLLHHIVHPIKGRVRTLDSDELAVDAEDDRGADLYVNVRSPALDGGLQDPMKQFHNQIGR